MWSTVSEMYPVFVPLAQAPSGQTLVVEPQTSYNDVTERFSVHRITGIVAYKQHGPMSTLHWVAKC